MNEELKKLSDRLDLLSVKAAAYSNEIAELKAAIARLKGEESSIVKTQPVPKRNPVASNFNFENFIGLKLIHFVGIIVLLIGLSIGVKYAIDAKLISPVMRIILAYVASLILFIFSFRLKTKFLLFSVILFSGAMASAYFTTYAAYQYYFLIPGGTAFVIMLLFTFFTVFNSLKYNRQEIAILGLAGAYAIPFFVSNNSGNIAGLFAYMFLINTGILVISFKKYWLPLTYISFFATWIIFITAMILRANGQNDFVFNIFAVAFFSLFLINCLIFKFLKKLEVNSSDIFIVIADSLFLYAVLCYLYYGQSNNGIHNITAIFSAAYLVGALAAKKLIPLQVHLANFFFAMSFIAATIFVAIKFEGFTVTIIWVLMAVVVFTCGLVWKIRSLRIACMALFAATLIKLLLVDSDNFSAVEKIIAWIFTGVVLLAVSFLYQKFKWRIFSNADDQGTGS